MTHEVAIARDFTPYPGGRYRKHGDGSGQEFREVHLVPYLEKGERIVVILDAAAGFPPSFLEEAFGGLIRSGYSLKQVESLLKINADEVDNEAYINEAWDFVRSAARRQN